MILKYIMRVSENQAIAYKFDRQMSMVTIGGSGSNIDFIRSLIIIAFGDKKSEEIWVTPNKVKFNIKCSEKEHSTAIKQVNDSGILTIQVKSHERLMR